MATKAWSSEQQTSSQHGFFKARLLPYMVGVALLVPSGAATAEPISCSLFSYLLTQSPTQFESIRGQEESEQAGVKSTVQLDGAEYCEVTGSAQRSSYRCVWNYTLGDLQAQADFDQLAADLASCFGDEGLIKKDQPVNHPDSYTSSLFTIRGTQGRIALKDKRVLQRTFVSFVIDGVRH